MENRNYYEILGVSRTASFKEITASKNDLAKRYHPDANIKNGIDTTQEMQNILEAYRILSDQEERAAYDLKLAGHTGKMQTFDLHQEPRDEADSAMVTYWKASGALYDIIVESECLFHLKNETSRLAELAMQAIQHVLLLRSSSIPEKYWHPDTMNWLLFAWYRNRNLTVAYLLGMYEAHIKEDASAVDQLRLRNQSYKYRRSVKRLMKY